MRATGKFVGFVLAAWSALVAGTAQAQWLQTPTQEDLSEAYPQVAREAGITGRVELSCVVAKDGTLKDCDVALQSPAGRQFDQAAMSVRSKFRMDITSRIGVLAAGKRIRIPIAFGAPADTPPMRLAIYGDPRPYSRTAPQGPYWPDRALRAGASGVVVVDCGIAAGDRLVGCHIVSENPGGLGFSDAVLKMAGAGFMTAAEASPGPVPAGNVWRFTSEFKNPVGRRR